MNIYKLLILEISVSINNRTSRHIIIVITTIIWKQQFETLRGCLNSFDNEHILNIAIVIGCNRYTKYTQLKCTSIHLLNRTEVQYYKIKRTRNLVATYIVIWLTINFKQTWNDSETSKSASVPVYLRFTHSLTDTIFHYYRVSHRPTDLFTHCACSFRTGLSKDPWLQWRSYFFRLLQ